MDIDGLGRLIEEKHAQTILMFSQVTKSLEEQREYCSSSMCALEKKVVDHENTITRIKTIGSLLSVVWGAIVLVISHAIEHWRKM